MCLGNSSQCNEWKHKMKSDFVILNIFPAVKEELVERLLEIT